MREAAIKVSTTLGLAVVVGVGAISLSGCVPIDRDPTALRIVNETNGDLIITAVITRDQRVAPNDDVRIPMDGCLTDRIEATRPDGTLVALLDEEYCHDQVWTITGVDEATLTDDS